MDVYDGAAQSALIVNHFVFLEWRNKIPDRSVRMANKSGKAVLADYSCLAPLKGVEMHIVCGGWKPRRHPSVLFYTDFKLSGS